METLEAYAQTGGFLRATAKNIHGLIDPKYRRERLVYREAKSVFGPKKSPKKCSAKQLADAKALLMSCGYEIRYDPRLHRASQTLANAVSYVDATMLKVASLLQASHNKIPREVAVFCRFLSAYENLPHRKHSSDPAQMMSLGCPMANKVSAIRTTTHSSV